MKRVLIGALTVAVFSWPQAQADGEDLATRILRELVAMDTSPANGNDLRPAMNYLSGQLEAAGFGDDITVVAPTEKLPNLVVRYRSPAPQRKPILMMAHIDVVGAAPDEWSVPPFELTERDGFYYGRGTNDNKAGGAMLVANLIRMKEEGFRPDRDLIVMLTADEETTQDGAATLARDHRDLIDAEFALNTDGGSVMLIDGRPRAFVMQTAEKVYVDFRLETGDPGGHSSVPRADSAISRMVRTLAALARHRFDISLNETTRAFFERWRDFAPAEDRELIGALLSGAPDEEISAELDQHPYYNALVRTTCLATTINGGHAVNAIPQRVVAEVNCRVLPQFTFDSVADALQAMAKPNGVTVEQIYAYRTSAPSPLAPHIVGEIADLAEEFWPGILIIPQMSTGATDAVFTRNIGIPTYGVSALADEINDARAHGQDERIGVESFAVATEYWYRLVKRLSTPAN